LDTLLQLHQELGVAEAINVMAPLRRHLRTLQEMELTSEQIPHNDRQCLECASSLVAELINAGLATCTPILVPAPSLVKNGKTAGG
jgi:hypothetical protein